MPTDPTNGKPEVSLSSLLADHGEPPLVQDVPDSHDSLSSLERYSLTSGLDSVLPFGITFSIPYSPYIQD